MPESVETTINVTIPLPLSRRGSVISNEDKESFAELTVGKKIVCFEEVAAAPVLQTRRRKSVPMPVIVDPTQEAVERNTGLKITGGSDFNMPITIFHVRSESHTHWPPTFP
jgi:hypothetical protein